MFYNFPVTQPMVIPQDPPAGKYNPADKELPGIKDSSVTGIRLLNTSVKALPKTPVLDSGTSARAEAAAKYARDVSAAFAYLGARQAARSRAIARLKDKRSDRYIKEVNKAGVKRRKQAQRYYAQSKNRTAKQFAEYIGMNPETY